MNNVIVKYITPMGEYIIDQDLKIYIGQMQDYGFTNQSISEAIIYIESMINRDLIAYKDGLQSQINSLQLKYNNVKFESNEYRIKL